MAKRDMKKREDDVAGVETTVVDETITEPAAPVEEKKQDVKGRVVAEGYKMLNVRKNPKANAEVIDRINVGTKVTILDIEKATGEWYKVSIGKDKIGYCKKQFIKLD